LRCGLGPDPVRSQAPRAPTRREAPTDGKGARHSNHAYHHLRTEVSPDTEQRGSPGCLPTDDDPTIITILATFAVSWLSHRSKDLASILDQSPGSVSRWLAEGLEPQLPEPSFRQRLKSLAKQAGLGCFDSRNQGPAEA